MPDPPHAAVTKGKMTTSHGTSLRARHDSLAIMSRESLTSGGIVPNLRGLQGAARGSRARSYALALIAASVVWLAAVGIVWLSTNRTVPIVDVRWTPALAPAARVRAEAELSLIPYQPKEANTARYLLFDPTEQ